jgi:hypothetical protein
MNLQYQQRLVAFIDILGFKQLILESRKDSTKINLLYDVLRYLKTWETPKEWNINPIAVEEDAQQKGIEQFRIEDSTRCTCFSDSIVISVLLNNNKLNEIASTLIANLALIGTKLIKAGILLRGGMTVGDLIHTEDGIILGQALIDAYELEQQSAKYPRIVLSDILLKELNYPLASKRHRYPYHQYLDRFDDGCVGFHQMIFYQVLQSELATAYMLENDLDIVRKRIIEGLDSSFQKPDVFGKYKWLAAKYNELIILKNETKHKIYDVNEADNSNNIHFSNIDEIKNR